MTLGEFLVDAGGALTILWGTAHLYPTRKVVRGFEPITTDNRRILTMEWIAEAILLIFTGALMVVMTARFGADRGATQTAAALSSAALLILAGVSASAEGRPTSSCTDCARRSWSFGRPCPGWRHHLRAEPGTWATHVPAETLR